MTRCYRFTATVKLGFRYTFRWDEEADSVTEAIAMARQHFRGHLDDLGADDEDVIDFALLGSEPV